MELKTIINSPALWIASSFIVIVILAQSVIFLRKSLEAAKELGISKEKYTAGMRAAAITSIGPSMGPVIILIALITIIGAPTTWMSLCDIGAARTEMAVAAIGAGAAGVELQSADFGVIAFTYALWAIALNNSGWMIMSLLTTSKMDKVIKDVNRRYDPKWIKVLMGSTMLGLFASLVAPRVLKSNMTLNVGNFIAAASAGISMIIISKVITRYIPRMQELSLGLSMLIGMFIASALV